MSLIENIKKRGLKDIFNLRKIRIFARYLKMRALKKEYDELSIPEYAEQIVYRMRKCPDCLEKGECVICSCKSPELFYDKTNYCEGERWKEMISPGRWETYKITHGITINPEHVKQLKKDGIIKY